MSPIVFFYNFVEGGVGLKVDKDGAWEFTGVRRRCAALIQIVVSSVSEG